MSWDPPFFQPDELLDALEEFLAIKVGQTESTGGTLQPMHVAIRTEESDFSLFVFVRLETLKALDGVVQGGVEAV
jgi:hypothetical protein